MSDGPLQSSHLADQLDLALQSIWKGNPSAFEDMLSTADGVGPAPQGSSEASGNTPLAEALAGAAGRLSRTSKWIPTVEGYEILREAGRGGMSHVWLARQKKLAGRLVALKVLPHSLTTSPALRTRFRAEAQAIARLQHPNIVHIYDVIDNDEIQAYAMEWIEGPTLEQLIDCAKNSDASRQGRDSVMARIREMLGPADAANGFPSEERYVVFICRVCMAMARALAAVHRAGLVHRDVKPSNILMRRNGTPLLSDFGLVREANTTTVSRAGGATGSTFAGTAAYAAPEQLRADGGDIDGRADIYGLGVTLYAALALRLPFQSTNHIEVLRRIQLGLAKPLRKINPKLPRDIETIVSKAMEPEADKRYQTADDLADDLERLINLQPIKAKSAGLVHRSAKFIRRHRTALVAGVGGGGMALAAAFLSLLYFILMPAWSNARLDQARLALLDPEHSDSLFSVFFWDHELAGASPLEPATFDMALQHYNAAIRYAPFDGDLALERDLVRLASEISARPTAAPVHLKDLPLTCVLASSVQLAWHEKAGDRARPKFDEAQLATASNQDLRALGLIALLCGEPVTMLSAWSTLDMRGNADALIEASFGVTYLIQNEPGRAYPRLRRAVEAFPNVGFLTVYLAEAAAECGDLSRAQDWLDQARHMPRLDRFNGLTRVQAGVFALMGKHKQARQLYEKLVAEKQNVVAFYDYALYLEANGEPEAAMRIYQRIFGHGSDMFHIRRRFVALVEQWWAEVAAENRQAALQVLHGKPGDPEFRDSIFESYVACVTRLEGDPPPGSTPREPRSDTSVETGTPHE